MKKILLTMSVLAITASNMNAQDLSRESTGKKLSKFRFGLFVAPGSAWLKPTSSTAGEDYKYNVEKGKGRTAFAFGLNAEKPLSDKYFLVSGVGLDWQGGTIKATKAASFTGADSSSYVTSADMAYKLQYLQIPLGLKLNATHIQKFQIFGQIGLDASILIGRKGTYTISGQANSENVKLPATSVVPLSLGMHFGIGTEFKVSDDNSAYASILYRNGFVDVTSPQSRDKAVGRWSDGNIRSNNLSLRIGYYF